MIEIKCKLEYTPLEYEPERKMLTNCIVTEQDGTMREICPLYYCQMILHRHGRFYYEKDMPVNYFEKAEKLRAAGWESGYHYNNDWFRISDGWTEYGGIDTDSAIKQIEKELSND